MSKVSKKFRIHKIDDYGLRLRREHLAGKLSPLEREVGDVLRFGDECLNVYTAELSEHLGLSEDDILWALSWLEIKGYIGKDDITLSFEEEK